MFFLWVYQEFSYNWIKLINMSMAFGAASALAYPAYHCREMVDLWPKERGGNCTWNNNYRAAFKWQIEQMDMLGFNFYRGYT